MSVATVQKTFIPNVSTQQVSPKSTGTISAVQNALDQLGLAWRYSGKIIGMTKQGLQIFLKAHPRGPGYEKIVHTMLAQLKIPSFCAGILNIQPLYSDVGKTVQYAKEGDYSSAAFSGMSSSLLAVDTYDSFETFFQGYRHLREFPPIRWVGRYSKLIALYLTIVGSISRIFKICHITAYSDSLFKKPLFNKAEQLEKIATHPASFTKEVQEFLQETVGLTPDEQIEAWEKTKTIEERNAHVEQLLDRKKRNCVRNTSQKVFDQLTALQKRIKQDKFTNLKEYRQAFTVIQNVRSAIFGKVVINIIGIAANVLTIVGLVLMGFTVVVAPWIPLVFIFLGFATRLANVLYEDFVLEHDSYVQEVDFSTSNRPESA